MKLLKSLIIGMIICLTTFSCEKAEMNPNNITITGTIQVQGITTYQYGTHTISGYALRSNAINLDNYVNQNVTIVGSKLAGYPVDGGPDYIEVNEIK